MSIDRVVKQEETPSPAFKVIFERLSMAIDGYEEIVGATRRKLDDIHLASVPLEQPLKHAEPESVVHMFMNKLDYLDHLNRQAHDNLKHLSEIA